MTSVATSQNWGEEKKKKINKFKQQNKNPTTGTLLN